MLANHHRKEILMNQSLLSKPGVYMMQRGSDQRQRHPVSVPVTNICRAKEGDRISAAMEGNHGGRVDDRTLTVAGEFLVPPAQVRA